MERDREEVVLRKAVARLQAGILAVTFGIVCGVGLFVATAWLLIRGGPEVGPTLGLLGVYFPGYRVTWVGSFVGLGYGAFCGALVGWSIGWIYNRVAAFRQAKS